MKVDDVLRASNVDSRRVCMCVCVSTHQTKGTCPTISVSLDQRDANRFDGMGNGRRIPDPQRARSSESGESRPHTLTLGDETFEPQDPTRVITQNRKELLIGRGQF